MGVIPILYLETMGVVGRAPTRAKKVRDSSSFKPNILLGHLSFELEMVEQSDMACNINLMEIKWN